jgi:raffinose/stachyose/melibiose transport system substrate-binding protein
MFHTTQRHRRRTAAIIALSAALAVGSAGCSALNPGGSAEAPAEATGVKLTADEVREAGDITLRLTNYQTGGLLDALRENIAAFEEEFPNITIDASEKDFADYGKTIALSMSSDTAPDIAEVNAAMAPRLVAAGLVRPLDAYMEAYGWNETYPAGIDAGVQLSSDGKVFGEGSYYGMALGGNLVGVYYNKALLSELGLEEPETFEELTAAMDAAAEAGILPLEMGNLDQTQAGHVASTLLVHFEEIDVVNDWINGTEGASIDTAGAVEAMQTLKDWVDAGYISSEANGIKEDDGAAHFADGGALFNITGSWRTTEFDAALGDDGGFMLLPGSAVNEAPATGWFAETWAISNTSENADIAAFFLDYLAGEKGQENNVAGGYLPFAPGGTSTGGPIAQDVMAEWYRAVEANGLSGYLDSASPTMGTTEFPALQSMIAGEMTAEEVVSAMQRDWDEYREGQ